MSKTLLEANFQTTDLRAIYTRKVGQGNTEQENNTDTATNDVNNDFVAKLKNLGFTDEVVSKLIKLGEPFKKACDILGFRTDIKNPILAFVKQSYVQEKLLNTGLLNISTFKAIYNTVANKLVADSEFVAERAYNIIYCPDLYRKSAKEMVEYLTLQSKILSPAAGAYDGKTQLENRRIFLHIDGIDEKEYVKNAKATKLDDNALPKVFDAKLNSIEIARRLSGSESEVSTVTKSNKELAGIVEELTTTADKLAALLALSTSTSSKQAQQALNAPELPSVASEAITQAFLKLSKDNILPKGQLDAKTADTLVNLIMATFKQEETKA
jgi:hypothetical protein